MYCLLNLATYLSNRTSKQQTFWGIQLGKILFMDNTIYTLLAVGYNSFNNLSNRMDISAAL